MHLIHHIGKTLTHTLSHKLPAILFIYIYIYIFMVADVKVITKT